MSLFKTKDVLSEPDIEKGIKKYTLDGVFSTSMVTLQGGIYITAFALAMGASQIQIGLIASIAFLSQLMQIPGLMLVNIFPRRKIIVALAATISRFLWLLIILIPFKGQMNPSLLLVFLLFAALIGAIPGPAWSSLLRDLLPTDRLGSINSKRIMLSTLMAMILTLIGGYFIDLWEVWFPENKLYAYSVLFGLGFIFGILGVIAIITMPEPTSQASRLSIVELFQSPIRDKNFSRLMIFQAVWNLAINLSAPFFIVYILNRLGYSIFLVTMLTVVSQITNIVFLKLWGRLADKFSNKTVLSVSAPLFLITIILWNFTAMPEPHDFTIVLLFIIYALTGMSISGVTLGTSSIALKLSPKDKAHSYMAVVGISSAIMGAMAPLIGGLLAQYFDQIQLAIPLKLYVDEVIYSVPIISLKGLDFVFLLTLLIGLFAVHRLAFVREVGEGKRKHVIDELTSSIIMPIRSLTPLVGLGRIAIIPISDLVKATTKQKRSGLPKVNKKV